MLIADDHAPTREDVRMALLESERFSICAEVACAQDAVEQALRERPDICLLDVEMPGGGINAARQITARLPGTAVVMFTAYDDRQHQDEAREAGASGCLVKTMQLQRLGPALLDLLDS